MRDHVAAAHGVVNALVALDVTLDDLDVVPDVEQVLATAGRKVVKNPDLVAVAEQSGSQMRPDESAPACHQRLHRFEGTSGSARRATAARTIRSQTCLK